MDLKNSLLILHISAGYIGLLAAAGAISIKMFDLNHRWHIRFGRVFFWAMMFVAISAIPLSLYAKNVFLLLIALFTGYLAHGGWRFANNHTGGIRGIDQASIIIAAVIGIGMCLFGFYMTISGDKQGITLGIFGLILCGYARRERSIFKQKPLENNQRIAMHLTQMLAATIASVTAFVVTNIDFEPAFVMWLAPTVLLVPVIVYWNIKLLR